MADAHALGACALTGVWVRIPPSPPLKKQHGKKMSKILITRRTFQEAEDKLIQAGSEVVIWGEPDSPGYEELLKEVRDIDGLYAHITNQVDGAVMDAAPNLKVITEFGVGYDNIDVDAANKRGIAVCNLSLIHI